MADTIVSADVEVTSTQAAAVAALAAAGTTGTGAFVCAVSPTITGTEIVSAMRVGGAAASATSAVATGISTTLASPASGSVWDGTKVEASTLTVAMGASPVTVTALKANNRQGPTILTSVGAGALTVTDAYTDYVGSPPVAGAGTGTTTITNAWSFGTAGAVDIGGLFRVRAPSTLTSALLAEPSTAPGTGQFSVQLDLGRTAGGSPEWLRLACVQNSDFRLCSLKGGSGSYRSIRIYASGDGDQLVVTSGGNVGVGVSSGGTSAVKTLVLSNSATAPSDSADRVHLYAADIAAGRATMATWSEEAPAADVGLSSTHSYTKFINGVKYKEMLVAV